MNARRVVELMMPLLRRHLDLADRRVAADLMRAANLVAEESDRERLAASRVGVLGRMGTRDREQS